MSLWVNSWIINSICSKSLILSDWLIHSFIHSCKGDIALISLRSSDMIWLQSLSDWVSSGFAYIHWTERRKPAVWFNSSNLQYVVLRLLRKRSRTEWDYHSSACGEAYWSLPITWKPTLVTVLDFKLATCGQRVINC